MAPEPRPAKTTLSREEKRCSVEGCRRPYKAKGYCKVHYARWRKGQLPKPRRKKTKKSENQES